MHAKTIRYTFVTTLTVWSLAACASSGSGADPDAGGDQGGADAGEQQGCTTEGATQCAAQTFQTCQNGEWVDTQSCTPPTVCDTDLGCVACYPEQSYCVDNDVYTCTASGDQGELVESCSDGTQCVDGACKDPCAEAAANRSYLGCEYWAVDLDNAIEVWDKPDDLLGCSLYTGSVERDDLEVCHDPDNTDTKPDGRSLAIAGLCDPDQTCPMGYTCETTPVCVSDAQTSPFAVVVSNPQTYSVDVVIESSDGQSEMVSVPAGQVEKIYPQDIGFPDSSVDRSSVSASAYKITSNSPIVAYQFNPLDNVDVFSNDGSLLIPRTTYDTRYYVMSWPTLTRRPNDEHDYNGYLTVVAWEDGTEVRVTPSADVRANGLIDAISSGQASTFTLDAFEVLNLESAADADLSGTLVEAVDGTATFGVFGGHEAVSIQNTDASCCADHVEEQMFPTSTWGTDYAIARSKSRDMDEPDLLRIMAQEDGTAVTIDPAPAEGSCSTLNAGEFCDVKIMQDTEVSGGDKPILIGHYLLSVIESTILDTQGDGDPALALAVPTEQFRSTYTFLVPSEYARQFVSIVAETGASVTLDGTDISGDLTEFGSGAFAAGRIQLEPGQHTIDCPGSGCGIEVYGYDDAVSYLFAGGLDLEQIVVD